MFRHIALFSMIAVLSVSLGYIPAVADGSSPVDALSPGLHLGYETFSPIAVDQLPLFDARVSEATDAGLDVARIMVDWAEVVETSGEFDRSLLHDQLERVPRNTRLFLTLSVTDVDRYSVPADLLSSDGGLNTSLDDPVVIGRYLDLMDDIVPELISEYGLFAISTANEPDVLLAERSPVDTRALATFTSAVNAYADDVYPGLDVTMTLSGGGVLGSQELVAELVESTDVATFNWGCIDLATFQASEIDAIPGEIELLVQAAQGRDIVIQELSCPSGYTDGERFFGATPEYQATWFETFFAEMSQSPVFRAAFVFDLVDWPEELAVVYSDFLRVEGLDEIADRYEELQRTWGLLTFDDLAPKPAWLVFLDAIRLNAN